MVASCEGFPSEREQQVFANPENEVNEGQFDRLHQLLQDSINDLTTTLLNQGRVPQERFTPIPYVRLREDGREIVLRNDPQPLPGAILPLASARVSLSDEGDLRYTRSTRQSYGNGPEESESYVITRNGDVYYASRHVSSYGHSRGVGERKLSSNNPEDRMTLELMGCRLDELLTSVLNSCTSRQQESNLSDLTYNIL